jgi:hypothetical protein
MRLDAASILPSWIRDNELILRPKPGRPQYPWMIGLWIDTLIDSFEINYDDNIYHWQAIRLVDRVPARVMLWMPINPSTGEYKYNGTSDGCRTMPTDPNLPHIKDTGCCMDLQGVPTTIKNMEGLGKLQQIINRGMRVVNLSSLLAVDWRLWHRDVKDQTPEPVKQFINHCLLHQTAGLSLDRFIETSTDHVQVATEARQVFTTAGMEARMEARVREVAARVAARRAETALNPGMVIDGRDEGDEEAEDTPVFRVEGE